MTVSISGTRRVSLDGGEPVEEDDDVVAGEVEHGHEGPGHGAALPEVANLTQDVLNVKCSRMLTECFKCSQ